MVDLWLLIIGIFVYFGATAEEAATVVHLHLAGRRVADVMLREPLVIDRRTPGVQLAALRQQTAQRVFPLVGDEGYVGLVRPGADAGQAPDAWMLADRSTPLLTPGDRLEEDALPVIIASEAKAAAVADGGRIVGLVRVEDIEHLLES